MDGLVEVSDDEDSYFLEIIPKDEGLDCESEPRMEDVASKNVASSSSTNLRLSLIAMGFPPSHVDRAIEEKGDGDTDILLETLWAHSENLQQPKEEPFDDGFMGSRGDAFAGDNHSPEAVHTNTSYFGVQFPVKEELDDGNDKKVASLLKMNFTTEEAKSALDRLGYDASIDQLMDFIFAARMAKKYEKNGDCSIPGEEENDKDPHEALYGIMEKTLALLEMGFSEQEISNAFEIFGSDVALPELADSIVAMQLGEPVHVNEHPVDSKRRNLQINNNSSNTLGSSSSSRPVDPFTVKTEEHNSDNIQRVEMSELMEKLNGKRPKVENNPEDLIGRKKRRQADDDNPWRKKFEERKRNSNSTGTNNRAPPLHNMHVSLESLEDIKPAMHTTPSIRKPLTQMALKPPHFLYGNVTHLPTDAWVKISHHLFYIQPEFVNSQSYSALIRNEGYVHNLPMEGRSHISPKGPMTIQEAVPHTGKWWPPWDQRKQISHVNCATNGISYHCDRFGRMLIESKGNLSSEKQRDLLRQCEASNLVWTGNCKLGPLEPEYLERIMGYPLHHTQVLGFSLSERLMALKHAFQTDTLGYHLSVLKKKVSPQKGLNLLSVFSGIGGAEVALHRLGFRLNVVVSVEPCESMRKILQQWWENNDQTGKLIQIESLPNLSGNRIEDLIRKHGVFDLVVCQNPSYKDDLAGVDLTLFAEFVRVLQRVRSEMQRFR